MPRSLTELEITWRDHEQSHVDRAAECFEAVQRDPDLKAHRDHVEANGLGFGDRSLHWMWKLLTDEMPRTFHFLEIGVHCGQVTSLVGMLACREGLTATVHGLSPYNGADISEPKDYLRICREHFDRWCKPGGAGHRPEWRGEAYFDPIVGLSNDPAVCETAKDKAPFDIVFIDGNHDRPVVESDVLHYAPLVKVGGYLVIDDSCCNLKVPGPPAWNGIASVCEAVDDLLPPFGGRLQGWKHLGNVSHDRIWRRLK